MRALIFALALLVIPVAANANVAVLGPEILTRTTGGPQTFTRQLPPANPGVEHHLVIKNGVVPADRVTSATVLLDGVQVFGPSDFKKTVAILSRKVFLRSSGSTLQVTLAGGPGSFIEISVLAPFEAYTVIPPSGGTAAVTNPQSPIFGTTIAVPESAVPEGGAAVTISFSETPPAPVPPATALVSKVFEFGSGGVTNFASPVSVTPSVPTSVRHSPAH